MLSGVPIKRSLSEHGDCKYVSLLSLLTKFFLYRQDADISIYDLEAMAFLEVFLLSPFGRTWLSHLHVHFFAHEFGGCISPKN